MEFETFHQEITTIPIYNKEQDHNLNKTQGNNYNTKGNIVQEFMEDNKYINESV